MSRSRRSRFRWRTRNGPGALDRAASLVRWEGDEIDPSSGHALGLFQLAARCRDAVETGDGARWLLRAHLRWFSAHLPMPRRFSPFRDGWRRSSFGWKRQPIAISWFKGDATEHLRRAGEMAAILAELGLATRLVATDAPGYVTYEDAFQVVAMPFA